MTQLAQTPLEERCESKSASTSESLADPHVREPEKRIDAFLIELRKMTPQERIRASRYTFTRWERYVYAARFPDEVPLLNGELEWIAATLE